MAEKQYEEGAKPRKVNEQLGDVGKGLAIGLGAAVVGGLAAGIAHSRETMRRDANIKSLQGRSRRIKVQRPDNL